MEHLLIQTGGLSIWASLTQTQRSNENLPQAPFTTMSVFLSWGKSSFKYWWRGREQDYTNEAADWILSHCDEASSTTFIHINSAAMSNQLVVNYQNYWIFFLIPAYVAYVKSEYSPVLPIYDSKLNIFRLWTKTDIWQCHLRLWETMIDILKTEWC